MKTRKDSRSYKPLVAKWYARSVNMDVSEFATAVVPVIAKMDSTSQSLIAGIVLIASISGMPELKRYASDEYVENKNFELYKAVLGIY